VRRRSARSCADAAPLFWIGVGLYAVGNGVFGPVPAVYAIDVLPPEHRGLGVGVFRSAGDFGARPSVRLILWKPSMGTEFIRSRTQGLCWHASPQLKAARTRQLPKPVLRRLRMQAAWYA